MPLLAFQGNSLDFGKNILRTFGIPQIQRIDPTVGYFTAGTDAGSALWLYPF
jgi:hypothetical protein